MAAANGHGECDHEVAAGGVDDARARANDIHSDLLRELTKSDLSEGSKTILRNLTSPDLILAYLETAEVVEIKWDLRTRHRMYLSMHPARECEVVGQDRAYINDSPKDRLEPLSSTQRMQVDTFFQGIWMRVTRARGMKQQEIMKTQIARSEVDRGDQDDSNGGLVGKYLK
jgi:hypothetical protein